MNLVPSLLQAIVRIDGEALVMHPGDKPYVVSPSGQVELASRGLTLDAVNGIVMQLLPFEVQQALDELGAVQYPLPRHADFPHEQFTVVVARSATDVWAEIRRKRSVDDRSPAEPQARPTPQFTPAVSPPPVVATMPPPAAPEPEVKAEPEPSEPELELTSPSPEVLIDDDGLELPEAAQLFARPRDAKPDDYDDGEADHRRAEDEEVVDLLVPPARVISPEPVVTSEPVASPQLVVPPEPVASSVPESSVAHGAEPEATTRVVPPPPAVVLPMSRNPIRAEQPPPRAADALSGLERLLRTAAARGASTLYLSSDARPSVRVDGQLQSLDSEPVHTSSDVVSLLLTLMPERSHESLRTGATTEWICDIEDIGRVRCMSFSDHQGPGGVFRLMPGRTVSVEQLGLPREVHALAIEPEGLVIVAGPRSSGKRTLISSLVDLINRTRRDYVITIEREVNIVHERGSSFISQREVRGTDEEVLTAARAALREDPDVLVLEQIRTGLLMNVAVEAAASGHLVIAGFSAHNAAESIDRILDLYAPEYARQVQLALADHLRGVVAQVLLPKIGGGRVAAREILLNTAAVASVIAEGKTSQLPMAIEGGRRSGMVPLNDALVSYVQSGIVDVREAYRYVADRPAFVAMLKRHGVDTSPVERLA